MSSWEWHRDAGLFILVLVVMCIIVSHLPRCSDANAQEVDEKAWDEWEKAAKQAGAGEEVPVPDDTMTPHDTWCKGVPGWCPTVKNGVIAGQRWCLGKPGAKKKPLCYYTHRYKSYDIYLEWKDWLDEFDSGKHGLFKAGTIRTESYVGDLADNPMFSYTPSKTKECGLASIDLAHARSYNVNACDARANIWLAQYLSALRLINLRKKYPQLVQAPIIDQWRLAGATGAIGSNKVHNLIDASGALRTRDDGTLVYDHPYERVLKWMMWKDSQDKYFFYNFLAGIYLGRNPGRGAFRVARGSAQDELFEPMFVHGLEWAYGEPTLPPRPTDILPFPGDSQHCQCWRWKDELEHKRPKPHKSDPDLIDPRTLA
jgi:hypothetical protein